VQQLCSTCVVSRCLCLVGGGGGGIELCSGMGCRLVEVV
jgi:hypothetical protein